MKFCACSSPSHPFVCGPRSATFDPTALSLIVDCRSSTNGQPFRMPLPLPARLASQRGLGFSSRAGIVPPLNPRNNSKAGSPVTCYPHSPTHSLPSPICSAFSRHKVTLIHPGPMTVRRPRITYLFSLYSPLFSNVSMSISKHAKYHLPFFISRPYNCLYTFPFSTPSKINTFTED